MTTPDQPLLKGRPTFWAIIVLVVLSVSVGILLGAMLANKNEQQPLPGGLAGVGTLLPTHITYQGVVVPASRTGDPQDKVELWLYWPHAITCPADANTMNGHKPDVCVLVPVFGNQIITPVPPDR